VLVMVITIGWRCTPPGHEPCHLLFNFEQLFDVSRPQREGQTNRRCDHALDHNQWFGGTSLFVYIPFLSRPSLFKQLTDIQTYTSFEEGHRQLCSVMSRTYVIRQTCGNFGDQCLMAAGPTL